MSDPDPKQLRNQLANLEREAKAMARELTADLSPDRRREAEFVLAGLHRTIGAVKAAIAQLEVPA